MKWPVPLYAAMFMPPSGDISGPEISVAEGGGAPVIVRFMAVTDTAVAFAMPMFVTVIMTVILEPYATGIDGASTASSATRAADGAVICIVVSDGADATCALLMESLPSALPVNVISPTPVAEYVHVKYPVELPTIVMELFVVTPPGTDAFMSAIVAPEPLLL